MNDLELISIGIKYLSNNIRFRGDDKNGKYGAQDPATEYAKAQSRVIRRILDFIQTSEESNSQFHDLVMTLIPEITDDIFQLFFKMWSKQYKSTHPIKEKGTYHKIRGRWIKEGSTIRG